MKIYVDEFVIEIWTVAVNMIRKNLDMSSINILRQRQNGRYFASDIYKFIFVNEKCYIFVNEKCYIFVRIWQKFVLVRRDLMNTNHK